MRNRLRWAWNFAERFPLGRAPVAMLLLLAASAPFALSRRAAPPNSLDVWVFAITHHDEYAARIGEFEQRHPGVKVNLQLIPGSVLFDKLMAAFLSDSGVPDLAEIEISSSGRFFQG